MAIADRHRDETMPIDPLPPFSSPEVMRKSLEMLEGLPDTADMRNLREQTLRDLRRLEEFMTGRISNHVVGERSAHSSQAPQGSSLKSPLSILASVFDRQADEELDPKLSAQKRFRAAALRALARQAPEPPSE
jgi:hypothetical protein